MAIVFKIGDLASPLSMDVAGPSVIFLIGCIPVYWFILFLYENKVFSCKRTGQRQQANNNLLSFLESNVDEDIVEEEKRVK